MKLTRIIYWASLVVMLLHMALFVITWRPRFVGLAGLCAVVWIVALIKRVREEPDFGEERA